MRPEVSVVLPVHNGMPYLPAAVESIITQDFRHLELIIVDDGSTDASPDYLAALTDERVRVLSGPNRGLVPALNDGISAARASVIARMDSDDVARRHRLRAQLIALRADENVGVVCSDVNIIDSAGRVRGAQRGSWAGQDDLRNELLYLKRGKPIIHPSVMMRSAVIQKVGGYRDLTLAEDRDLWLRLMDHTKFVRLTHALLDYRIHAVSVSRGEGYDHESASVSAVVNYVVQRRVGIDLFFEEPELFGTVLEFVKTSLIHDVGPARSAFVRVRDDLRARRYFRGTLALAGGLWRHGGAMSPDHARRTSATIISNAVELATTLLREKS